MQLKMRMRPVRHAGNTEEQQDAGKVQKFAECAKNVCLCNAHSRQGRVYEGA